MKGYRFYVDEESCKSSFFPQQYVQRTLTPLSVSIVAENNMVLAVPKGDKNHTFSSGLQARRMMRRCLIPMKRSRSQFTTPEVQCVRLVESPPLTAVVTQTRPVCDASNGAGVVASGGKSPYAYEWLFGGQTASKIGQVGAVFGARQ